MLETLITKNYTNLSRKYGLLYQSTKFPSAETQFRKETHTYLGHCSFWWRQ